MLILDPSPRKKRYTLLHDDCLSEPHYTLQVIIGANHWGTEQGDIYEKNQLYIISNFFGAHLGSLGNDFIQNGDGIREANI